MDRPKITHVAIRFNNKTYALPAPNRHHHVIQFIIQENPDVETVDAYDDDQGFLDESGAYLTRRQALVNALLNNQIKDTQKVTAGILTSEDVW